MKRRIRLGRRICSTQPNAGRGVVIRQCWPQFGRVGDPVAVPGASGREARAKL